jgi:isopentenyl diphosphate isomerase/L-lactate dehydrogenase-like FMN-dependent dehydrogenase
VLTDSGYRRGADILKALALGADAVLLGRATRWALGAFGPPGVQRLLEIIQRELVEATAAAGRTTRASIDAGLVRERFV